MSVLLDSPASGVERAVGRCERPDHKHRNAECKHIHRVEFATGVRPIPVGVDVDELLGEHTDSQPQFARADGGIIEADDEDKIINEESRPDDCTCWDSSLNLPCFACYKTGFDEQNPAEPAADE